MRASMLAVLFIVALASSRQAGAAETSDTIDAMQLNCLPDVPAHAGSDNAQCQTCVETIGNLPGLTSQRMYACYSICQNDTYVGATDGPACVSCISDPLKTVQACIGCFSDAVTAASSTTACLTCLGNDPWKNDAINASTQYLRDQYFWACAQCNSIPTDGGARAQCEKCISTKNATLQGSPDFGIVSWAEYTSDGYKERANDFGACVYLANQTYLIATYQVSVTGQYANCVPEEDEDDTITVAECLDCMKIVEQQQAQATPNTPLKSYACADYCQNPLYYPPTGYDSAIGSGCITCVQSAAVTHAWACGNCMKSADPLFCFSCVQSDPYSGNTSNYNWACGMCANVADPSLRNLCLQCIQSQPGVGAENTTEFTESNICSCIDLIQNSTFSVNRSLTAMERTCFEPFQYYNSTGDLVVPEIPWGVDPVIDSNNSACLNCMKFASEGQTLPGLNKAYACHEYCQNPDLVKTPQQGLDCAVCVVSPTVTDPWACQVCMQATDNDAKRKDCFTCLRASSNWTSHSWGCSQCAQFSNPDAYAACYQCLSNDAKDPCACVDGVKNGSITYIPPVQNTFGPENSVCEHSFATIACVDTESLIAGHVITSISNVYYGRRTNDYTTCKEECKDWVPAIDEPKCPYPYATAGQGCSVGPPAWLQADLLTCYGEVSCNLLTSGGEYYAMVAENSNFTDPCVGVFKYLEFEWTCGPPAP